MLRGRLHGTPCTRCGCTRRYKNGECVECRKAYNAQYRAQHGDRLKQAKALYRKEHPEAWAAWYGKNKERARLRNRQHLLKRKYGLTLAEYDQMLKAQGGACAICGSTVPDAGKPDSSFHVDHCHSSGVVRGLLCALCNVGIGHLREDPNIFRAALRYLEQAKRKAAA